MGKSKNKIKVKSLFPIRDKQQIYANLESFEWDFTEYGFVYLCFKSENIKMKYIGYGNIKGIAVLILTLADARYNLVEDICNTKVDEIFIERDSKERET